MGLRYATEADGRPSIRIHRLKPGHKSFLAFLGRPEQFWCHYIDSETLPCLDANCPWCPGPLKYRAYCKAALWQSYADRPGDGKEHWDRVIVEFTDTTQWQSLSFDRQCYRAERGPNNFSHTHYMPCRGVTSDAQAPFPEDFELIPALCRVWGLPFSVVADNGVERIEVMPPNAAILRRMRERKEVG